MMRSIYVTNLHKQNPTHGKKQELAHSVEVASVNYAKGFDEDDEPAGKSSEDIMELREENSKLEEELKECEEQKKANTEDDSALFS